MRTSLHHRMDDTYDAISRVMAIVPTVVDYHKPEEDADPWVLAMALQIQDCGHEACIVTEDVIDRDSIVHSHGRRYTPFEALSFVYVSQTLAPDYRYFVVVGS